MELQSYCLMRSMSLKASSLPSPLALRRLVISGEGLSLGAAHRESRRDLVQGDRTPDG